jgi:hypothetical protein
MSDRNTYDLRAKYTHFRILVIGRTNAGKTRLLQRVCNTSEELGECFIERSATSASGIAASPPKAGQSASSTASLPPPLNVSNFLNTSDPHTFPRAFADGTIYGDYAPQHTSDLVRWPLLKYGGVYADVGLI